MGTLGGSNKMLSVRDVAELLDIAESTVYNYWRAWGIPFYRVGRALRVRERDLWAWFETRKAA